jgi:hypothetical protein
LSTARRQRGVAIGEIAETSAKVTQAPTTTCAKRTTSALPRSFATVIFSSRT